MALTNGTVTDSATPSEAVSTEQLVYQHSTIDKAKRAFRLLILQGGTGHDIDCKIVESTIDSNTLPYEAVSYTWGPGFTADTVNINGKKLPVTFNLSLILRDLRFADVDRVIWVDAICINQQDGTEKGHQVGQMQDIYALAERVLFCIARSTNCTDLLMGCLERLQSGMQNIDLSDESAIRACWNKTQTAIARHHLNSLPQPSIETLLSVQLEAMTFLQRQGLEYILGQPWFHRVWILQEVANARDALVYCGQKSVSAAVFALGARLLEYSLPDERRKTVDEVLTLMPGITRKDPSQDLLTLFRRFGKANASVERDRIYALFGICEDKQIQTLIIPNYVKPEQEVIIDTIAYICHCEISAIATSPYNSTAHFLSELDLHLLDNTLLSHFLGSKNHRGALSILQRHGQSISVTPEILSMAVNHTMFDEGVMSQLLEQRNAKSLLSGPEGRKPLCFAAEHGYDILVIQMLEKGADIQAGTSRKSVRGSGMEAPLSLAAMDGHETVVRLLLERGSDLKVGTPLAWAARNGHSPVVQLLVEKGSEIEEYEQYGLDWRTPLSWASSGGHEAVVRFLLQHGADPTTRNLETDTPISRAAENGHMVILQILLENLLENSAKIDESIMEDALINAATAAQKSVVSLLLNMDLSINLLAVLDAMVEKTWKGDDRQEDFEAIVMMIMAEVARFHESSNPLVTAAAAGNERMVRLFLNYGAKVDYVGTRPINGRRKKYSGTALAFATRYGHKDVAELLLAEGAHLEARNLREQTPLFAAASSGVENIIMMLLEKGAASKVRDSNGRTPLHLAAQNGHENSVRALLKSGADVDSRDKHDATPLCLAAYNGHENIIRILLESGADIKVRDRIGCTPLCAAAYNGHENSVRLLLKNGADIESRNDQHRTALSVAASKGCKNTVRELLKNGADIDSKDKNHRTALSIAASKGYKNVVKVLLKNGAEIEAKDSYQRTPLTWAAQFHHKNIVTLLLESGASSNVDKTRLKACNYS